MRPSPTFIHMISCFGFSLLMAGVFLSPVEARYRRPELAKVPVERLRANLEQMLAENPSTPEEKTAQTEVLFNLARLHAMAYAQKTDTAEMVKGDDKRGAWFGFEPKPIPFDVAITNDADELKAAKTHLEKAISFYEATLKMDREHLSAQLGLAWCLDQSGKKPEAITAYRKVVDNAWKIESKMQTGPLGFHPVTAEAAGYLIPLLDADRNGEEIAQLKLRSAKTKAIPRPITPLIVPLTSAARLDQLIDTSASVKFDADGSGLNKRWTWVTPEAGWLVYHPHETGQVTSALQMFGNVSFWLFWENGYHALSALDDNHDGQLTGRELDDLAIWQDHNGNGINEPGEIRSVADWDIVELSCRGTATPKHAHHAALAVDGATFRDGSRRTTYDVLLKPAD